jgi:hypothetical protein
MLVCYVYMVLLYIMCVYVLLVYICMFICLPALMCSSVLRVCRVLLVNCIDNVLTAYLCCISVPSIGILQYFKYRVLVFVVHMGPSLFALYI